ncbi:class I adenylate-forming enzyme family protein [Heyndrickxia ginsengihumi]|uniref:class I adenylate-forming enzyme family protein n=1 Tax=Heyndrickxia ginsengihumi TaxID=363870 RepID=UPI00046EBD62|nr:class I adenylate-forming enzyme family protein [Heyndrickxia ginsengihumi]
MSQFYSFIFEQMQEWDKEILITNKNKYTFRDLHSKVEEFIHLLQQYGDVKAKKIAILTPNLFPYLSLIIAINHLGGTVIPLNPQLKNDDLASILSFIEPNIVFTVEEVNGVPIKRIIKDSLTKNDISAVMFTFIEEGVEKEQLYGTKDSNIKEEIDFIVCTSGSTGLPKGIKLSARAIKKWTEALKWGLELEKRDQIFLTIPVTAAYGITWLLTCLHNRVQMVIPESFDMPIVLQLLRSNHCNKLNTTPSIFKGIYLFSKQLNIKSFENISLCALAGEQVNADLVETIKDIENCRIINSYGLSEQGVLMYTNDIRNDVVEWTMAKGNQYKVDNISENGIGELMIKTSYGFDGYYLNDGMTQEVLSKDGWFATGDLVTINEQGKIHIVGRKKHIIKKGGVQVIPAEIELFLNKHPKVANSAVVGVPHTVYGEEIFAFIVPKAECTLEEIFSYLRKNIANVKIPGNMMKISELPIIQGKVDKVTLRNRAIEYCAEE